MNYDIWLEEQFITSVISEVIRCQVVRCVNCDGSTKESHILFEGVTREDDWVCRVGDQDG